jgi:sporulation protein YlmC with PRC-barrel domain
MRIVFGTRVLDSEGNAVGTVRSVVLHPQTRQIDGLVVHQGLRKSREVVVPMAKVASTEAPLRLALKAADLADLPLFNPAHLRRMPDHWNMPVGFDERDLFMVGGSGWMEAVMSPEQTSPEVSGTPAYVTDKDSAQDPAEPDIVKGTAVYDSKGSRVGDVEAVDADPASGKITWIVVRRGHLFSKDTTVPASVIKSVTDRVTLNVTADAAKRLESA